MKDALRLFLTGAALFAAASLLTGCEFISGFISGFTGGEMKVDNSLLGSLPGGEAQGGAVVSGNTLTYGSHTYTIVSDIDVNTREYKQPTASVSFTNFPASYSEFEAVYKGLLGKSIAGTAAMIPMAIELYARDADAGGRCFSLLCNGPATVDGILRILKTKLVPSQYAPDNDPYIQRYMAAALLKGAVNTNAYTPDTPYTVEMTMSPNGVKDAPMTGGEVTYIYILAHGWDTYQRSVEIMQPYDSDYYKVFNCPSCYTQCKIIRGDWPGLK